MQFLINFLVLQTRKAFTPEQINEACYVDMNANKAVFDSMRKNPKVSYDGKYFSYKVGPNLFTWKRGLKFITKGVHFLFVCLFIVEA